MPRKTSFPIHSDSESQKHFIYMINHLGHFDKSNNKDFLDNFYTCDGLIDSGGDEKGKTALTLLSSTGNWDLEQAIEFNGELPTLVSSCVHELVSTQAEHRPNTIAVHAWDGQLTYLELDQAANRLAHFLINVTGIHLADLVHVCFEKSIWFFVAILAINKTGAAWVPLDPSHPRQRQQHILKQTRARLALTSPSNATICTSLMTEVLEVTPTFDRELVERFGLWPKAPLVSVTSDHAAYVLFTSGSTGVPKGFVMEHGSVCTSQAAISSRLGLKPGIKILQFASYVFDLCIGEIIAPLISGATVCVPSEHTRMNNLTEFINAMEVNWAFLTPSFARTLKPDSMPGLELLLLTGEAVGRDVFEAWVDRTRLVTGWGPAETCVFSTLHEWKSRDESPQTIGRPVGAYCWIVDPEDPKKLAPTGWIGEVMIQGPTLLREYLNDATKTTAATVAPLPSWAPNAVSPNWNRFFKSGDLCRYNPNGTIEFVSRKDTQVKIRGLRVELGEVEHNLRTALPNVRQVVVDELKREGGNVLAAYFCYSDDTRMITAGEDSSSILLPLTQAIQGHVTTAIGQLTIALPSYMIPTAFFPCKFMPSITSTKVDRSALKQLATSLDQESLATYCLAGGEKRPPETPMELRVQDGWSKILKIPLNSIGRDDSFFRIGGDSITAIRFVAFARDNGLQVTAKDIFADPRLFAVATKTTEYFHQESHKIEPFSLIAQDEITTTKLMIQEACGLSVGQEIEDIYPCTSLQEGLMALTVKQPGSYIAKHVYRLPRKIDRTHFESAWKTTLDMCPNLRTRIVTQAGNTIQAIIREDSVWESTEGLNLKSFMHTSRFIMQYGSRLCRYALITEESGDQYFVLIIHHAVFDGWSLSIALEMLSQIFSQKTVPAPEPYSGFINYTQQTNEAEAIDYWKAQLDGGQRSKFPRSKPTVDAKLASRTVRSKIKVDLTDGSITKATIIRATWALVLSRYCDSDDVCFGTTVSGRQASVSGIHGMVGPTVATLPIRLRLNRKIRISDFLETVQQQSVDMVPYEQYGLHNISKINQEAKEACDFSSLLVVQPAHSMESNNIEGADLLLPVALESDEDNDMFEGYFTYPLVIQCFTYNDHIELLIIFNPNLIFESQIEALSHHFSHTFQQLLGNRDRVLSEVSLASDWDLQRAREYNPGAPQIFRSCVHQMVEKQALIHSNVVAVDAWDGQLNYSELNLAANRLSHHLRDVYGVQTGDLVHVCFEKSIWFFVSILAINKAGAAWVPLDPSYPIQRQQQIVQQTQARVALSSPSNGHKCTSLVPLVLEVSSALDKLLVARNISPMPPVCGVTPDHAAYVLFTSGSTGIPKGLVMQHQALCTSQMALGKHLGLSSGVRMLQFSSFVFDICIGEIIGSWIFGATVCVPSDDLRMNGLGKFVNDFRVNWAYLTSSFTRTLRPSDMPGLELLVLSGEFISRDVFETWVDKLRFIAAWGPAETCVWNTIHECHSKEDSPQNIGRPVGSYCWIVDPQNPHELAPVGCVGEILIQGPTLLQEYLADPVRTAASVLTELPKWAPDASLKWNRFFRSGDLGYYNPDGTIEFVSRKDTQVKIRGLRIELGEIEHHLRISLPSVHWVAVDILKGETGTTLAAYFCFNDIMQTLSASSDIHDILLPITLEIKDKIISATSHLNIHLPSYMIPTMFFPCRFMPSVISGKLDRNSLKRSTATLSQESLAIYSLSSDSKRAPETPMEGLLQQLWSQILKISTHSIGRDDSFLRIGGDSITAIQFVTLARESGLNITVKDIFADPRLYAVAEKVFEGKATNFDVQPFELLSADVNAVKKNIRYQCQILNEEDIEDAYPCSGTQEGLMALAVKQPGSYTARYVYQLSSQVDTSRFKAAWECVLETCSNLRTSIIIHEGSSIQTIIKEKPKWEHAASQVTLHSFMESRSMSHMQYGSRLCRYALVEQQNGERFFVLVVHHSIFDGWGLNIVLERLCATYLGVSTLGLLPYSSFINYLIQIDETEARRYWNKELAGAQRAAFPPAALQSTPTCRVLKTSTKFPVSINNSITRATILRTAWAILLACYSSSNDICFGTTVSGRHAPLPNVENMPGPTIATVPVRIKLARQDTLHSLLQKVQLQASEMVAYEQFGLRNIARVSSEAKDACDFSSLLVIQPMQTMVSGGNSHDTIFVSIDSDTYNKDQSLEGYFNYPLVGLCTILEDRFGFDFIYDSNIINELTLQAFSRQFGHIVDQLCGNPDELLENLDAASPWDIQQALQWNQHDRELVVSDTCLHQIFANQAQIQPEEIAIDAWDKTFTYDQLNKTSNRVSHLLINGFGVKPGDLIHVCFEKSAWFIVAILAINKAGGAWVPLDPSNPPSRHKQIVQQTKAKIAVASPTYAAVCSELVPYVIELSTLLDKKLEKRSKRLSLRPPAGHVAPTDPAYVLFTSGTTGVPKGVVMEHGSVCTSQTAIARRLDMRPGVRILQFSAFVFDVSVAETIGALISGACVCIPSDTDRMNNLSRFIRDMKVTWAFLTPAFARTIKPQEVPSLELLLLAGEAVGQDVFDMWYGKVRLFNGWGPAETCVFSSLHEWVSPKESPLTIGRPVGGFLWIVDSENPRKLAPTGCVGEIVMQGPTLLREYLHEPTQTAKALVTSLPQWAPRTEVPCWSRFYLTGDLGYYNADGTVEYIGRKDTQIKIRGLRIELGEVEQNIRTFLTGVKQVAADVIKTKHATSLVAYFSYNNDKKTLNTDESHPFIPFTPQVESQVAAMVSQLRVSLPQYMVPTAYIPCQYLPFNSSGKLDRKRLRSLTTALNHDEIIAYTLHKTTHQEPVTEMEIQLQKLWSEILNIPTNSIGLQDSFLALGGDSISAIQLVTLAAERGIGLTVAIIFDNQILSTIAASASFTANKGEPKVDPWVLVPQDIRPKITEEVIKQCQVHPNRIEDVFPCTPLQHSLVAFAIQQPGCHFTRYVFELSQGIDLVRFKIALRATVLLCINLRTRIIISEHGPMQVIIDEKATWKQVKGFPLIDVLNMPRAKIGYGTPLSFFTFVSDNSRHYFIWDLHHAVYDGNTMQLVSGVLQAIYNGQEHFHPVPFQNYINYTLSTNQDDTRRFWLSQLEGANITKFPETRIPLHKTRSLDIFSGNMHILRHKTLTVTTPSLLRAAWAFVLASHLKIDDVVFGCLLSGRDAPVSGIQKIIGPTHSNVPCRVRINRAVTIAEFLLGVQEQANAMIPFGHTGLQNIAKFSDTAREACNFQHILITQPVPKLDDNPEAPFRLVNDESMGVNSGNDDYEMYPLVIQCLQRSDGNITVLMKYNHQYVMLEQIHWLYEQFSFVATQLATKDANEPLWKLQLSDSKV